MVSGNSEEIAAQTKAIMNTFNNGILLRGRMPAASVLSGRLYIMDKSPNIPAPSTVGKFRKGRCEISIMRTPDTTAISLRVCALIFSKVKRLSSRSEFRVLS